MKQIEILDKILTKSLTNDTNWDITLSDYQQLSEIEKNDLLERFLASDMYSSVIFNHKIAQALWGTEKSVAYYVGYNEWGDATQDSSRDENIEYDKCQHMRMPLWEYHLMMLARSTDRLKYLQQNI